MTKPEFAYLLLSEHPYGREMLRQILSEGFVPAIVITEDSAIGDEEREKFLVRISGNPVATTVESQLAELESAGTSVPRKRSSKRCSGDSSDSIVVRLRRSRWCF